MKIQIARTVVHLIERSAELRTPLRSPHRQAAAAVVLKLDEADLTGALEPLYEIGAELGQMLTQRALQAIGCAPTQIEGYGKAAIVGTYVPLECAAALLHPRLGKAVRGCLPGASSIMPSVTKRGSAGASVDIPMHSVKDAWSFDHFDSFTLCVPDSPAPDELLIAVALAERGRPLARVRPD